jgi:hypothetical protein
MPSTFNDFDLKTTPFGTSDKLVGFDGTGLGGEKKWNYSTLRASVSSQMVLSLSADNIFTATGTLCARSLANRFADVVNVKDFGAIGDGVADDTTAFVNAINFCLLTTSPDLYVSPGNYIIDYLLLDSISNLKIYGAHSQDRVSTRSKTNILWKLGSTQPHLLRLRSCNSILIQNINFYANGNTGKQSLIQFECNGDTTPLPLNKFANSDIEFSNCNFGTGELTVGAAFSVANVWLKSSARAKFKLCEFDGYTAIKIGADTDAPAGGTGSVTIPDGRATRNIFEECIFRGDVVRERSIVTSYLNCSWVKNSVPYSGSNYQMGRLKVSGNEEVQLEYMLSCNADAYGITNIAGAFYQSPEVPSTAPAPMLVAVNNYISGAGVHFDIRYGKAILQNNRHAFTNLSGSTFTSALRTSNNGVDITWIGNDTRALDSANATSTLCKTVVGSRTTLESNDVVIAKSLASNFTLSNSSGNVVLSRELNTDEIYIREGVYEFSYSINMNILKDSEYEFYITINGSIISETRRKISGLASSPLQSISLPPARVVLQQTNGTVANDIQLVVRQITAGPSWSEVLGTTYKSWVFGKYIGA